MSKLPINLACGLYDRTQALRDGTIGVEGVQLNFIAMQAAEIFWRMLQYKEFEASELSMSNYISMVANGDSPFVAIPVFLSRVFRHGFIFINSKNGIEKPEDLAGKRGGVPEYSQTAAVYLRGFLEHDHGVKPSQVEWIQSRASRVAHALPPDVKVTHTTGNLNDMLDSGEIDFLLTANKPACFRRGAPHIRRLFPDYRQVEREHYKRTGIYPIMHAVVIRKDVYDRNPWVALSLYRAFVAAKDYCCQSLLETGTPKASFAWLDALIEDQQAVFGPDWFPYGVEKNRASLDALLQYTHEQGLTSRRISIEELFAPSTLRDVPMADTHLFKT
jgi:4,5-dihydroxyphthalate decarboxylase